MKGRLISVSRELVLRLLGGLLEALQGHPVLPELDVVLFQEGFGEVVHDALVEVFATEMGVAVGRLDAEDPVGDLEDRDIERASSQIVDRDALAPLLLEAVRERSRRRLVDDALDVEARDLACVLGGLTLRVVEVGRDRDHRFGHLLPEVSLGDLLHLREDERAHLGRRHVTLADSHPRIAVRRLDDRVRGQALLQLRLG